MQEEVNKDESEQDEVDGMKIALTISDV